MNRRDRKFGIGTIVRHFKGRLYRIEDFARHTENNELLVVYRELDPPYYCYAMPEPRFCSETDKEKYPNADQDFRFEKVTVEQAKDWKKPLKATKAPEGSKTGLLHETT